jgi:hypothetical protein
MGEIIQYHAEPKRGRLVRNMPGAGGGEVSRFVSRSERERVRLIREARAIYDRIVPPADTLNAQQNMVQGDHLPIGTTNPSRSEGILS